MKRHDGGDEPKRISDYVGRKVKLLRKHMTNGRDSFEQGEVMHVLSQYRGMLVLIDDPTKDRRSARVINGVIRTAVELLPEVSVETMYHVTFHARLKSIAKKGLVHNERAGLSYALRDGVFLSVFEGVRYWFDRAIRFAEHSSDDPVKDQLVPVVLRIELTEQLDQLCQLDVRGSQDSGADAVLCRSSVPARLIELWNGSEWIHVMQFRKVDPRLGVIATADGEEIAEAAVNALRPRDP